MRRVGILRCFGDIGKISVIGRLATRAGFVMHFTGMRMEGAVRGLARKSDQIGSSIPSAAERKSARRLLFFFADSRAAISPRMLIITARLERALFARSKYPSCDLQLCIMSSSPQSKPHS